MRKWMAGAAFLCSMSFLSAVEEGEGRFARIQTDLVNILTVSPKVKLDVRYATGNNFIGIPVYNRSVCYLHKSVAAALACVQADLEKEGLGLKVFDGYRPMPVQQLMWDKIQEERHESDLALNKGRHTRGTAVDLTLVRLDGKDLEMPTDYDEFTDKAYSDCQTVSNEARKNRQRLKEAMEKHGFEQLPLEWWHFDFIGWNDDERYPSLSIALDHLL